MFRLRLLILLCTFCCGALPAGTGKEPARSFFDEMSRENLTTLTLRIDLSTLEANRRTVDFMPATAEMGGKAYELSVAVRGRFRRTNCAMPPLKLRFAKAGLRARGLNTHNDFKLVTHCTDDEAGQQALLREKLAYDLYQALYPEAAFRTHLLKVNYVNTVDGATTTSYAILIEDVDELKDRMDVKSCKDCYNIDQQTITNAKQIALFQYMIGNADFSTRMIRNVKLMTNADGTATAVPYDFDFSGVVDATYALPKKHLGQQKITDRTLVWEYNSPFTSGEIADEFFNKETELLRTVAEAEGVSKKGKRRITKYLVEFFDELRQGNIGQVD